MAEPPNLPSTSEPQNIQRPTQQPFSSGREAVELVSKIGIGVIGVAYVVGLLIMNMHVRGYGLSYLGFLQIEYIMVGFLWLFLVSWVFFAAGYLLKKCGELLSKRKQMRLRELVFQAVFLLVPAFGIISGTRLVLSLLSEKGDLPFTIKGHWKSLGILFFTVASIWSVMSFTSRIVREKDKGTNKWHNAFYILQLLFWILLPLRMYATSVYPTLSPAFGGGKARRVALVIKADQLEAAEASGLKFSHGRTTEPVELIFEAPDFFLIRPPDGFADLKVKAVRLRKDVMDAAFYLGD
jgi:hypothetical protein